MASQVQEKPPPAAAPPPPVVDLAAGLPPGVDFEAALKAGLFKGLTPEQIREFLMIGTPKTFAAGEVIIREGDTDTDMYILLRGHVNITKKIPPVVQGGEEQQKTLFEPEVPKMMGLFPFGDANLLAGLGRSATITAVEVSDTLVIAKEGFEALCERDARLGYVLTRNITNGIIGQLIATNSRVAKLTLALTLALQKRG
jgi:CRP/FNR family cyclic AMP-dependent transcriptional regulator